MNLNYPYLGITLASTTTLFSLSFLPSPNLQYAVAQMPNSLASLVASDELEMTLEYKPPIDRNPKRTRGSGTRGSCPASDAWLRLLVPTGNFAEQTVSGYPVFSWYVTRDISVPVEFALIEEGGNQFLLQTRLKNKTAGINQLQLPDFVPELAPGKVYEWSLTLICDELDSSQNISYYGWVQRVASPEGDSDHDSSWIGTGQTSDSSTPWRESPQRQQVIQFAQNGQWYDALAGLLEARAAHPNDSLIQEDLVSLLEQAGLTDVVERLD